MKSESTVTWYDKVADFILDDLENFYERFYTDSKVVSLGGGNFRLDPCPKCGHHDCATAGAAFHCFSCNASGTHINAFISYCVNEKGMREMDAIRLLEEYSGIKYSFEETEESRENFRKKEVLQKIRRIAIDHYTEALFSCKKKYRFIANSPSGAVTKMMTPLEYQIDIRKHSMETLRAFKVGFAMDHYGLKGKLIDLSFSEAEIKEAKVYFPEGVFIYTSFHPASGDILRMNIKNPFQVTRKDEQGNETVIQGQSTGEKVISYAPGFKFNKPCWLVEGENDALSVYAYIDKNVAWLSGNPSDETIRQLSRCKAEIYLMMDHDAPGSKYVSRVNTIMCDRDVYVIHYDPAFGDPDDYVKAYGNSIRLDDLISTKERLKTEEGFISRLPGNIWVIENRHKKLEFEVTGKDKTNKIVGKISLYNEGKLVDREEDKSLSKCRTDKRPFNFILSDYMDKYFNENLEERTFEELLSVYSLCSHKSYVIKMLAVKLFKAEEYEAMAIEVKQRLGGDISDAVLKELNDLHNRGVVDLGSIPKITVSHYFNIKNNNAYFYYNAFQEDADAPRVLPFLIRNDKKGIRLDLLKRKDPQCLLLIDKMYELQQEIEGILIEQSQCSLTQKWVERWVDGRIPMEELSPTYLIGQIESLLKRFYHTSVDAIYKVLAMWIFGTYLYDLFAQYPYLFINGEKGSGKTSLDISLSMLAFNARTSIDISEAALFRSTSIEGGTMILDEMENLTSRSKGADSVMSSVLKGGYQKFSNVVRFNPDKNTSESFETYSPKVISNIFGLEDIVEDRCLRINTYRMSVGDIKIEDPKIFKAEKIGEAREVTSKCCLSAITHFQSVYNIFERASFKTQNARLTQIMGPVYAIALTADIFKNNPNITLEEIKQIDLADVKGEYTTALMFYFDNILSKIKQDTEDQTPEGITKFVIKQIAMELTNQVAREEREYTVTTNHRYSEEIKYDPDDRTFEVNVIHMKCFLEENMPMEQIDTRSVHKWMKACFNLKDGDIRRANVKIESETLLRELNSTSKLKVQHYKFSVDNILGKGNEFLNPKSAKKSAPASGSEIRNAAF